jgi:hypothetical protein
MLRQAFSPSTPPHSFFSYLDKFLTKRHFLKAFDAGRAGGEKGLSARLLLSFLQGELVGRLAEAIVPFHDGLVLFAE